MPDNRILVVQSFLDSKECGTSIEDFHYATEFVDDADTNKIDWRILPIVWVKESTCGKRQLNNNGFGWLDKSGHLIPFSSFENSVAIISKGLSQKPYAGKNLKGLITKYCPTPSYYPDFMGYYSMLTTKYNNDIIFQSHLVGNTIVK